MKKLVVLIIFIASLSVGHCQQFTLVSDANNPIVSESPNSSMYSQAYTGCSWVDIDHDDDLDLFYSGKLFANQGDGTFRKYTGIGSQDGQSSQTSCSWGDFNNDGHLDVLYSNNIKTSVYTNDGLGGLYIHNTLLGTIPTICWSAQFTDFNNDGWLDLTLTFADGFHAGHHPVRLFSGSETGLYPIRDTLEFLNDLHPYTVSYFSDYDLDGDQDLFIASGPGGSPGRDFHYKNNLKETGEAVFEKITNQPWASELQDGQNYNFIDIDNDGDLDMCLTNWAGAPNRFYRNDQGSYVAVNTAFTTGGVCLSNAWGDFDNDSYIDVIITAGGSGDQAGYYRNNGNGTFDFKGNIIKENINGNSAGISLGDYDNDGDLDFFTVGMEKGLFINNQSDYNNWINIALTGIESNTAALGAIVKVKATIRGQSVWQTREISAQNTFMGHNSLRLHFGLSDATKVDSLEIYWPSGLKEIYTDLNTKEFYKYTEGESLLTGVLEKNIDFDIKIYPNPVLNELNIEIPALQDHSFDLAISDLSGRIILKNYYSDKNLVQISLNDLAPGLYNVVISGKTFASTERLIVVN